MKCEACNEKAQIKDYRPNQSFYVCFKHLGFCDLSLYRAIKREHKKLKNQKGV